MGHPADRPIYFSCDFDAAPTDQAAIDSYLTGVADVISLDRTGVYGSYYVVQRCFDNKTAGWAWQTAAWSGDRERGKPWEAVLSWGSVPVAEVQGRNADPHPGAQRATHRHWIHRPTALVACLPRFAPLSSPWRY